MRFKLSLLIFALVTVVLVISSLFSYVSLRHDLDVAFEESKRALAVRLQMSLAQAFWNYDEAQLATIVEAELRSPDIERIQIYQAPSGTSADQDTLYFSRTRNNVAHGDPITGLSVGIDEMRIPLLAVAGSSAGEEARGSSEEIGYAKVSFSRARIDEMLFSQIRRRFIEIVCLNAMLGLALFGAISRMVTRPLARLSHAFKELALNGRTEEISIRDVNEFGEVIDAFNQIERRLVSDINRRVEAERSLSEANQDLKQTIESLRLAQESLIEAEKFASLGSLVAGVAHEINTPVGITVTSASLIVEEAKRMAVLVREGKIRKSEFEQFVATVTEAAQLALNNSQRAAHLIQSFKQVAADETSEVRRPFDLGEYLDEVLTSLRPKYRRTKIHVGFNCPPGIQMNTYPGLLTQVLSNIVINALTHGFAKDDEGEVRITANDAGATVVIECFNSGKPIPPEHLPRIFEPFFTTRRGKGGTGLGLNIAYNIVTQRLGGTIAVRSSAEQGTCFTIRMPKTLGERESEDNNDKA